MTQRALSDEEIGNPIEPTTDELSEWRSATGIGRRKLYRLIRWYDRYRRRAKDAEARVYAAEAAARLAGNRLEVIEAMTGFRLATKQEWVSGLKSGDVGKLYGVMDTSPHNGTPKGAPMVLYQVDEPDVGVMFAHPVTGALYHSQPGTAVWLMESVTRMHVGGEQVEPEAGAFPERPLLKAAPMERSTDEQRDAAAVAALASPQTWRTDAPNWDGGA